jgi:ceramide glucosyltransferase
VPVPAVFPPITVLKPLKGIDGELYENLLSIVHQDYPDFEVIFGIEDPDDPAVEVALRVKNENPQVRIRLATGAPLVGMNPKVNNLLHMVRNARNDYILISDSNVRVGNDYLRALAGELSDPSVGMVHSVLVGRGGDTVGSLLENLQMNTITAYGASGMEHFTGLPLVIGKSMLLKLSNLEKVGGLLGVANLLAEDYVLGLRFHAAGFKVRLSPYRIGVVNAGWGLPRFINRQLRWSQMRRNLSLLPYLGEPLIITWIWSAMLIPAALLAELSAPALTAVLAIALLAPAVRFALESRQVARLRGTPITLRELAYIPLKDLVMLMVWVAGFFKRSIDWRGTQALIGRGTVLTPIAMAETPADGPASVESAL